MANKIFKSIFIAVLTMGIFRGGIPYPNIGISGTVAATSKNSIKIKKENQNLKSEIEKLINLIVMPEKF